MSAGDTRLAIGWGTGSGNLQNRFFLWGLIVTRHAAHGVSKPRKCSIGGLLCAPSILATIKAVACGAEAARRLLHWGIRASEPSRVEKEAGALSGLGFLSGAGTVGPQRKKRKCHHPARAEVLTLFVAKKMNRKTWVSWDSGPRRKIDVRLASDSLVLSCFDRVRVCLPVLECVHRLCGTPLKLSTDRI